MIIYLNSVGTYMYYNIGNELIDMVRDDDTLNLLESHIHLYTIDGGYSPYFEEIT